MKFFKSIITATITCTMMLTVLTGCGGVTSSNDSTNTSNNSSSSSSQSSDTPTPTVANTKDTIRLPLGSEIDSLDPMNSAAGDTNAIMMNVFEGLLGFNEQGEFIPELAESYEILNEGLTYKFYLKEGVTFHQGEEFLASDVVHTYNQLAGFEGYEASSYSVSSVLESIVALDDYTIEMNLLKHDSSFLSKCINPIVKEGYEDNSTNPNGTGPYKFVEYIHGEKVKFTINEDYSTTNQKPSVKNIEVNIMTDSNAILLALKTGQLDIATILANDIGSLEDEFNIIEFPQNMVQVFALNNSIDGFDNPDVRKAINLAINKDEIIELSTFGAGTKVETFLSPVMALYYNTDIPEHQQDIELAKTLLADAGYEDLSFTCRVPSNYQTHVDTAQVIKDQLAKIGVTMEIELIEWAVWLDDIYNNANYEATVCAHTGKLDPVDYLNKLYSSYGKNYFRFNNARFDELMDLCLTTFDEDELIQYTLEAQAILAEENAAIFIQDPSLLYATTKDIGGVLNYPYRYIDFSAFVFLDI